jgi:hypothetical protein
MFKIGDIVERVSYPQKAYDVINVDEARGVTTIQDQIYGGVARIWPDVGSRFRLRTVIGRSLQSASNINFWRRCWRDGAQTQSKSQCLRHMCISMIAHDHFVRASSERT